MMFARKSDSFTNRNSVQLVKSGTDFFDLLEQLISGANRYIHLQTYIFAEDETGVRISKALIQAARRNIKVYLVIDSYASQDLSESFIQEFINAGVHFHWFDALFKSKHFYLGRRMHHKVLVVDGAHGMVGGINISNHYNGTAKAAAWLDYAVYICGEAVQELQLVCERRTVLKSRLFKNLKIALAPDKDCWPINANSFVGVRVNDWVRRKNQITTMYLQMLRQATSRVIIMSPYFIPGRKFTRSMINAADRGVKVQLILAGVSDVHIAKFTERYIYNRLFHNNIEIYEYQKRILHGKISTCDGSWLTVGSYNINNISAYASIELNLEIRDDALSVYVEKELLHIIEKDCQLITKEEYQSKRNFFTKGLERVSYLIFRLLFYLFTFYLKQRRE